MRSKLILALLVVGALANVASWYSSALADGRSQPVGERATVEGVRLTTGTTSYRADSDGIPTMFDGGESFAAVGSATATNSGIAMVTSISCGGYPTVTMPLYFSVQGATCVVSICRYDYDAAATTPTLKLVGYEEQTVTATSTSFTVSGAASLYPGKTEVEVQTKGCAIVKILFADPSSGFVVPGPANPW